MAASVVLLRGINIGPSNRIAMPALRQALAEAGFENARTYVQSGNIVLDTDLDESELSERVGLLITERFGLVVPAVARDGQELARIVATNPFPELAERDAKRFQVTFLNTPLRPEVEELLVALPQADERVAARGREIYTWHSAGIARSKLWAKLGAKGGLGKDVHATSRNWTTVTTLRQMATGDAGSA